MTIRVLAKAAFSLMLLAAVSCGAPNELDTTGAEQEAPASTAQAITFACTNTADQVMLGAADGSCATITEGVYNTAQSFFMADNSVTYVTLGSNMTAVLYDLPNLQGRPYQVPATGTIPQTIQKLASSAVIRHKVSCGAPSANQVVLHVDAASGSTWPASGGCSKLNVGEYRDAIEMGLANDALSGIEVGSNVQVDVFKDARFSGATTNYAATVTAVTPAWNDVASSVKVRWARNCPAPEWGEAVLWENQNFTGRCSKLKTGNYTNAAAMGFPNDALSSIQVGGGVEVAVYFDANFGLYGGSFGANYGALPAAVNDLASSVRVRWSGGCPEPKPNQVVIYQDAWYQGFCKVLEEGTYSGWDQFGLDNDSISSVKVGSSVNLLLYQDANMSGPAVNVRTSGTLASTVNLSGAPVSFNDLTSSIAVTPRHQNNPYASVLKRILILKCKGSNVPEDTGSQTYIEDLFSTTGKGTGGFFDYWTDQTYGAWDMTNVTTKGWYTMQTIPQGTGRYYVAQYCNSAAAAAGFTYNEADYASVIMLTNWSPFDDGATGYGLKPVVIHAGNWTDLEYITHEVGHAFGFYHSRSTLDPTDYRDPWDLMSARGPYATSGVYGRAGVGLNAFYRNLMGAIQPARKIVLPNDFAPHQYTLIPLEDNALSGYHYVEVPAAISNTKLLVSFRLNRGFDTGLPSPQAVFIHQDRNDKSSYVVNSAPGAEFTTGESYNQGAVKITVMSTSDIGGATVKFEPRAPCAGGFICCQKWYCPPTPCPIICPPPEQ